MTATGQTLLSLPLLDLSSQLYSRLPPLSHRPRQPPPSQVKVWFEETIYQRVVSQNLKTVTAQLQQPLIRQNVQVTLQFQTLRANIRRAYCYFQAQEVKKKL